MVARVGIPSTLLYYLYYPLWQTFFKELGVQVVTSGRTTRSMLDYGVREALADACVPIKLYFGHVLSLKDRVDYLFVPRVVCLNGQTTYCPKFLGLPDMIRHALADLPPLIDVRMDVREGWGALFNAFCRVGKIFGAGWRRVAHAYWKAHRVQRYFRSLLQSGWQPTEAMGILSKKPLAQKEGPADLAFAVLGYPYIIHDQYISVGLLDKLRRLGVRPVTAENLPAGPLARQPAGLDKRLFWTFSDLAIRATQYLLARGGVDGILHLTAFGCGPDAILDKFMELIARERSTIPFMSLTVDEHSGEAGITTRLEAFVDMVRRKKGVYASA